MRTLLSRDAAQALLHPYMGDLAACLRDAHERYTDERRTLGPVSPKARACLVNDFANENARSRFVDRKRVRLIEREHAGLAMVFDDTAVVKFKKLDHTYTISAIPTQQAQRWDRQEPLDGFPSSTNLVAGYVLDDLGELEQLPLVCSLWRRKMWALDLDDGANDAGQLVPLLPPDMPYPDRAIVRSDLTEGEEASGDA